MIGLIDKYHWGESSKITREQASEMAERLGRMELHLASGNTLLEAAVEQSEAFLQNRKARTNFSGSVH
jgi:phosphosulfolactate synthase (CoM biosynthesis protein A)